MIDNYINYLKENRLFYRQVNDTLISFSSMGLNMYFVYDKIDPYFARIVVPTIADGRDLKPGDWERIALINAQMKLSKVVKIEGNVWISCEQFIENPEDCETVFNKMIRSLKNTYDVYARNMVNK